MSLKTYTLKSLEGKKQLQRCIYDLLPYFATGLLIIFLYVSSINVQETINVESLEVGGFAFQFKFFFSLFPIFLKALFNFEWFSIFTYLFLGGICFVIWNFKKCPLLFYLLSLFFGYLFLYSSHNRSYYFIKTGFVTEFETLRYLTTIFPFYCLICGFFIYKFDDFMVTKLVGKGEGVFKYSKVVFGILLGALLIIQSQNLKKVFFEIEQENRILPITTTLSIINDNKSIILTDEPLLFQIFGSENLFVINLYQIGKAITPQGFKDLINNFNVYYLHKPLHDTEIEIERHKETFRINEINKSEVYIANSNNAFKLYLLKN